MRISSHAVTEMDTMDEALSKTQLKYIVKANPDGIIIFDRYGRTIFANAAVEKLLGVAHSVVIGRYYNDPAWKMTTLDGRPFPEEEHPFTEVMRAHKPVYGTEYAVERPDGSRVMLAANTAPLYDEKGAAVGAVSSLRDITKYKKAEKALWESRERILNILESITDAFFSLDREWRFTYLNSRAEQLLQRTEEELLGKNIWDELPEAVGTTFYKEYQRAMSEKVPVTFEEFYQPLNIWVEVRAYPYRDGLSIHFTDITERKSAEEELEFKSMLLDSVTDSIFVHDFEGNIIYVNEAAYKTRGYTKEELLAMPLQQLDTPEYARLIQPRIEALLKTGSAVFESAHFKKDGTVMPLEIHPRIIELGGRKVVVTVARDVTERKRVEQALRESEELYRSLVETSPEAITLTDVNANIIKFNQQAAALYGVRNEQDVIGRSAFEFIAQKDRERARNALRKTLEFGSIRNVEYTLLREDGAPFLAELSASVVVDAKGNPKAIIGTVRDITERRRIEEALRSSESRYRGLFEYSPISLWEEDFSRVKELFDGLRSEGVTDFREYFGHHPEAVSKCAALVKIIDVNEATIDMYEAESKKGFSERLGVFLGSESFDVFKEELIALAEGKTRFESVAVNRTLKRRRRDIVFRLFVIPGYEETLSRVIVSVIDITEPKQAKEFSDALNDINAIISSTLDFDEIMQRVVIEAAEAIGCETGVTVMREDNYWVARYLYGLPQEFIGTRFTGEDVPHGKLAVRTKEPVAINDTLHDSRVNREVMERYGIRSMLVIPLLVKEEVISSLTFAYHSRAVGFTDIQIDFARKLGASVSLALENARLYEAERNIADTLQAALLSMPEEVEGIEFGYLYRSATEAVRVGGDFYDIFEIEHGKVGIIVGDVSGKGIEAATLTSLVKNTITAHAVEDGTPALIMAKTNDLLVKASSASTFITVFFGVLDVATGKLTYCSAGHPPALIKRRTGDVDLLTKRSPMIGAFSGMHYRSGKDALHEGDTLIAYTDGLIEARCNGELLGEQRLVSIVKALRSMNTKEMPQAILTDVMRCTGGKLLDDVAVLSVSLEND